MEEPYADCPATRGDLMIDPDEIYRRMVFAHHRGWQIAIHVIGDAANRLCVELYARLLREYPRSDHRHRLEHASVLDARTIDEIARLGLVVSAQPLFLHSKKDWLPRRLGTERVARAYPFRSLLPGGGPSSGWNGLRRGGLTLGGACWGLVFRM